MTVYDVHAAKTHLSRLIRDAMAGEEVVIARDGQPAVRLVPTPSHLKARHRKIWGSLKGKIPDDTAERVLDPLDPDELDAWEGKNRPDDV